MENGPLPSKHSAGRLTTAARAELLLAVTLATTACAVRGGKIVAYIRTLGASNEPVKLPKPAYTVIEA